MQRSLFQVGLQIGLFGLAGFVGVGILGWPEVAIAQITSDQTLSTTIASPDGRNFVIDNGDRSGGNLFHSFRTFSVPTGGSATFNNAPDVQNIFSRVTGNAVSNIDGLLRANGSANLFLLNPNGIIFGNNAQLNIGGSFIGSTANSLRFTDGLEFSAVNASQTPLLTISTPVGLNFGDASGMIQVNGLGSQERFPNQQLGLTTAIGQTFALIGSEVAFNGGIATAPSGRLEVGSVARGSVNLLPIATGWQLDYSNVQTFGTIQLRDRAALWNPYAIGNPQGGIQLQGSNINLNNSLIGAVSLSSAASSDIVINASDSLNLGGVGTIYPFSSIVVNLAGASGNSGDVQINAPRLTVRDGTRIQTISQGSGDAGNVRVNSRSVLLRGYAPANALPDPQDFFMSQISSAPLATGNGGDVRLTTRQLRIENGAFVGTVVGTGATGRSGDIQVDASHSIRTRGANPSQQIATGILSFNYGIGSGGNIRVTTPRLTLRDGGEITSYTESQGQGGDVWVRAEDITARGVNPRFGYLSSSIQSSTAGSGQGGDVRVETERLRLLDGATVASYTIFPVNGTIAPTSGTGNAGNITVQADDFIEVVGVSSDLLGGVSAITTSTFSRGDGGDSTVSTRRLSVREGGTVSANVVLSIALLGRPPAGAGTGQGGDLTINARELIEVIGVSPTTADNSEIGVYNLGSGRAGRATINTPELKIQAGGAVGASTAAIGSAGRLTINASDIQISGTDAENNPSSIGSSATLTTEAIQRIYFLPAIPTGDTGSVTINTDRLAVTDGAEVSVRHQGTGNAGRLRINADTIALEGGQITASTVSGRGGDLRINADQTLWLDRQSTISAEAGGQGNGGNIRLSAPFTYAFHDSDIIANADRGNGGRINIASDGIFGTQYRDQLTSDSDITATSNVGVSGTVKIDSLNLDTDSSFLALPGDVMDSSQEISQACAADQDNQFIITGQGGVPMNPNDISSDRPWSDLRDLSEFTAAAMPVPYPDSTALLEANSWQVNAAGAIELVTEGTGAMPAGAIATATCGHE
jgi:filamentous hemagglutinin family protein